MGVDFVTLLWIAIVMLFLAYKNKENEKILIKKENATFIDNLIALEQTQLVILLTEAKKELASNKVSEDGVRNNFVAGVNQQVWSQRIF